MTPTDAVMPPVRQPNSAADAQLELPVARAKLAPTEKAAARAEIDAAIESPGVAIIMKIGYMRRRGDGVAFEGDMDMADALSLIVDVAQAQAAVPADRERILADARTKPGGLEGINAKVVSAICASMACVTSPEIQAAACGDDVLQIEGASEAQLAEWAKAAAGSGFVELLKKLLRHGARVDLYGQGGHTPIIAAAQNGQLAALRLCLAAPGGAAAAVEQDEVGITALALAAASGSTAEARSWGPDGAAADAAAWSGGGASEARSWGPGRAAAKAKEWRGAESRGEE